MTTQTSRTMQEYRTAWSGEEVLRAAKDFFARRNPIYAAFIDREGPTFVSLRGQGGEEVVIGVSASDAGGTLVTGSTYLFDMQVARFFATLPPAASGPPVPDAVA